ncbi:integrase [Streptomyces sp. NPDC001493]
MEGPPGGRGPGRQPTQDARHAAATVLLILGVPDAIVDAVMGWEPGKSARMHRRYQHLTNRVLTDTADKIGGLLWPTPEDPQAPDHDNRN